MPKSDLGGPSVNFGGSVIRTAPKHRVSPPKSITLKVLEDTIPLKTNERAMYPHEAALASGFASQSAGFTDRSKVERVSVPVDATDFVNHGSYVQYRLPSAEVRARRESARAAFAGLSAKRAAESAERKSVRDQRAAERAAEKSLRDDERQAALAMIRATGFSGKVTARMLALAKDVLASNAQMADYASTS